MKKAVFLLSATTLLGFILSPTMEVIPHIQNQISEAAMMLLLGLSLIGVARIFRAEKIKI